MIAKLFVNEMTPEQIATALDLPGDLIQAFLANIRAALAEEYPAKSFRERLRSRLIHDGYLQDVVLKVEQTAVDD